MGNTHPRSGHHSRRRGSRRLSDYDGDGEDQWLLKSPLLDQASDKKPGGPPPSHKPGPLTLTANEGPTGPSVRPPWAPAAGYDPIPAHQIVSQLKLRVSILEFLLKKQTVEMEEMKLKNAGVNSKVTELAAKIDDMILLAKNNDDKDLPPPTSSAAVDVPNLIDMNDENYLPPPQPSSATVDVNPNLLDMNDMKLPPSSVTVDVPDCDSVPDWQLVLKSVMCNPTLVRIDGMSDWNILLVFFLVFMVIGLLL
ncbi:unnamed protein product [Linum trigynum]|uniref:Uncharacterized protein n=1 Tax=Linum trigynum TaxID=586398 RepID=A0AAV2C729_9ROSI